MMLLRGLLVNAHACGNQLINQSINHVARRPTPAPFFVLLFCPSVFSRTCCCRTTRTRCPSPHPSRQLASLVIRATTKSLLAAGKCHNQPAPFSVCCALRLTGRPAGQKTHAPSVSFCFGLACLFFFFFFLFPPPFFLLSCLFAFLLACLFACWPSGVRALSCRHMSSHPCEAS